MIILFDCEESQAGCIAARQAGHESYSCDLIPCSGGHPEWHIQDDAIKTLYSRKWDLVIAYPPCTRLANSGVRWLTSRTERAGYEWSEKEQIFVNTDPEIWNDLDEAITFFNKFVIYGKAGNKIRIENPIQHKYARRSIDTHTQIIHPWQFGHGEQKATCLWNYNLPDLVPTNIVAGREQRIWKMAKTPDRAKLRSKTYAGIAQAFATQY